MYSKFRVALGELLQYISSIDYHYTSLIQIYIFQKLCLQLVLKED